MISKVEGEDSLKMLQIHRNMQQHLRYVKYCLYICFAFVGLDKKYVGHVSPFSVKVKVK